MKNRIARLVGAAALSCGMLASTYSAASAADVSPTDPNGEAIETVSGDEFNADQEDLTFPDAPDELDTTAAAKSGCSGPWAGYAPPAKYKVAKALSCNIFGRSGYKKRYSFEVGYFSNSRACAQGRGYSGSGSTLWVSLGCGKSGAASVPWGNRVSYPMYRAKSQLGFLGAATYWR